MSLPENPGTGSGKTRILFVDDEVKVLQGLERMLHSMRHVWDIETVDSGEAALARLEQEPFDVIVTDMRMPGMDGAQLLNIVMRKFPHIIRIVLSGQSDQETVLRSVGATHQYLAKPCDAETIKAVVYRACKLQNVLKNSSLRKLVSQIQSLPSLPSLYADILEELRAPEPSLEKMAWIISHDAGMTSKILHLVNSSFFGFYSNITDPSRALNILGLDKIRSLVLTLHIFSELPSSLLEHYDLGGLWQHSLQVSQCAKEIALLQKSDKALIEETFMAGLLHDTGKLILVSNLPDQYGQALRLAGENHLPFEAAEREIFGASHAEVGAYLFGLWGLSNTVIAAVTFHHNPCQAEDTRFSALTALHVANGLVHEGAAGEAVDPDIDQAYLRSLNLADRLPDWKSVCKNVLQGGKAGHE